ncbi:MAG: D-alanyl-D-alanine carboxypeptidase family protein [Oscillospiraceae bacterium]|jgi:D-alanyl-D-alanine carboxypeptidase (penicillin-binding protein 5/6)
MKRIIALIAAISIITGANGVAMAASPPSINTPSAILMEKETGTILYEQNAHERLAPASVTKIMTILLIVESIDRGELKLSDIVTASTRASSMGGSQIYLKEGEQMSVEDLLKSVIISSANDAAVALAEQIAGSEDSFTSLMNDRAKELGMNETTFINCTGLPADGHLTTAYDIGLMSRELLKHDLVKKYSTVWMDTVRNGEFGLTNTNRLVRFYEGTTGLKTGFTSTALHCLAASAERDGMELIAVVLKAPTSNDRFEAAKSLLGFGFANYALVDASPESPLPEIHVELGENESVAVMPEGNDHILVEKSRAGGVTKTVKLPETVEAPVKKGTKLGEMTIQNADGMLMVRDLVAAETVERLGYFGVYKKLLTALFSR